MSVPEPLTPVVGPQIGNLTVELAVAAHLNTWIATHTVAAGRRYAQQGAFDLTVERFEEQLAAYQWPFRPRQITVAGGGRYTQWLIDSLPHVQVWCPRWVRVAGNEEGLIARYEVNIACLVGLADQDDTRLLRAMYEDALLGVMDGHRDIPGLPESSTIVTGGGPAEASEISAEDSRTFSGAVLACELEVPRVSDWRRAPVVPDPLPDDANQVPPVWPYDPTVAEPGADVIYEPQPADPTTDPDPFTA